MSQESSQPKIPPRPPLVRTVYARPYIVRGVFCLGVGLTLLALGWLLRVSASVIEPDPKLPLLDVLRVIPWLVVALFFSVSLTFLQLLPGNSVLRVDDESICVTSYWSKTCIPWAIIDHIALTPVNIVPSDILRRSQGVCRDYIGIWLDLSKIDDPKRKALYARTRKVFKCDSLIPNWFANDTTELFEAVARYQPQPPAAAPEPPGCTK